MSRLSSENFGVIIAYLLPGFVALWGVSYFSPTVASWIVASREGSPTVTGFMYVTLASLAGSRDALQKYYSRTQQLLNSRSL